MRVLFGEVKVDLSIQEELEAVLDYTILLSSYCLEDSQKAKTGINFGRVTLTVIFLDLCKPEICKQYLLQNRQGGG